MRMSETEIKKFCAMYSVLKRSCRLNVSKRCFSGLRAQPVAGTSWVPLDGAIRKLSPTKCSPADVLYIHEWGNGDEPVVLLHGLTYTFKQWLPLVSLLNQRKFKYIMPDLLGHGRSPAHSHITFDVDTHLHYIYRDVFGESGFRKKLKGPVRLIGHDLGAVLALEIASRTPQLVQQLTLISLPVFASRRDARNSYQSLHPINHVVFYNKFTCAACCGMFKNSTSLLRPLIPVFTNKPAEIVLDAMACANFPAIYETLQKCIILHSPHMLMQAAAHLDAIGMTYNLIHGSKDPIVQFSTVEKFVTKFTKYAQLDVLAAETHDPVTQQTDHLAAHLHKHML